MLNRQPFDSSVALVLPVTSNDAAGSPRLGVPQLDKYLDLQGTQHTGLDLLILQHRVCGPLFWVL